MRQHKFKNPIVNRIRREHRQVIDGRRMTYLSLAERYDCDQDTIWKVLKRRAPYDGKAQPTRCFIHQGDDK